MTKNERISQVLKEHLDEEDRIRDEFWASHGGRPKGKCDLPRILFEEANAEFLRKWKELKDEYNKPSA